jgi:hypothetical protein
VKPEQAIAAAGKALIEYSIGLGKKGSGSGRLWTCGV